MRKPELVAAIAEKANLTKEQSTDVLNAFLEQVSNALSEGDNVSLIGFGTFEVRQRAERQGKNPKTGEPLTIPAAKVPAFKPGKALKERVQ